MATSQITIRHTGQVVDCGEDADVEATGCDIGIAFAAALLRAGRSRRRRGVTVVNTGVDPDVSAGTCPRLYSVLASSSSSDPPSTMSAVHTAIILCTSLRISVSYSSGTNAVHNAVNVCPFDCIRTRPIQRSIRP